MLATIALFSDIVQSHKVELQIHRSDLTKTKIKLVLVDGSVLFLREIIVENILFDYSYQWMNAANELIVRWDNTAHYPSISTFPHHKHVGSQENVLPSQEQNLFQVLSAIRQILFG